MANEHVLMTQKSFPISMTVADGTAIEKGTVLQMIDPNAVSGSNGAANMIAGICYTEKIANNGMTSISVLSGPGDELRGTASGSIGIGEPLMTATSGFGNYLALATEDLSGSAIIGTSKEAATVGQTFMYTLNIGAST